MSIIFHCAYISTSTFLASAHCTAPDWYPLADYSQPYNQYTISTLQPSVNITAGMRMASQNDKTFRASSCASLRTRLAIDEAVPVSASKQPKTSLSSTPMSWARVASTPKPRTNDPFANIELNPAPTPTWAEIFDVERMEDELVAMKAAGISNAYSDAEKHKADTIVQRGFVVTGRVNMGAVVGRWVQNS